MVKTFSSEMEICRLRQGHDVVWLVEVDWDGEVGRYGSRSVTIGGSDYRAVVAGIRGLRLSLPSVVPGRDGAGRAVEVELVNTTEEGADRFELDAEEQLLEGRTVRVGFVFLDPTVVLDAADIVWIQTFQVEAAVLETARAVLRLRESPWVAGGRLIGRRLLSGVDPQLSPAGLGRMIPIVFGRIERSPLIPFRVGRRGFLRQALAADDTVVAVEDVSIFPPTGLVQVNDEVIAYAEVDSANDTLGSGDSPVVRSAPARHRRGAAVDSVPENGFEYLVADHACLSVGPVFSGEHVVSASDYTVDTETLAGREVQKVTFPTLPSHVHAAAAAGTLRIDGLSAESFWSPGSGDAADQALAAVDGMGQTTAAIVDESQTPLELDYYGDLTKGASLYGAMSRCLLAVEFSASQRWSMGTDLEVTVGRGGGGSTVVSLNRPALEEALATLPAHSHVDSIRGKAGTGYLFRPRQYRAHRSALR